MTTERVFVDTNVLIYAHDLDAEVKRAIAEHVLRQLWEDETGVLSSQVLQEFYAALTSGASPVPRRAARDLISAYSVWPTATIDAADLLTASDVEERYRLDVSRRARRGRRAQVARDAAALRTLEAVPSDRGARREESVRVTERRDRVRRNGERKRRAVRRVGGRLYVGWTRAGGRAIVSDAHATTDSAAAMKNA